MCDSIQLGHFPFCYILHMQFWETAKHVLVGGGVAVVGLAVAAVKPTFGVRSRSVTATSIYVNLICVRSCIDSLSCWCCSGGWWFLPEIGT